MVMSGSVWTSGTRACWLRIVCVLIWLRNQSISVIQVNKRILWHPIESILADRQGMFHWTLTKGECKFHGMDDDKEE